MSRIRTIKPEFPQSETIGKLTRDARLLFIQLWTIVDDDGRARAASRMLASLLYPYDDDAPTLIEAWLADLEQNGCIRRYVCENAHYLEIINWAKHQKIDHKTASKLPAPPTVSEVLAKPREASRSLAPDLDLGPRIGPRAGPKEDAAIAAPADPEWQLFSRGKEVLGKNSGGLIKQLLAAKDGKIPLARAAIETASLRQDAR